ncbi:hypothetical protein C7N43_04925 [Sphingobacteriales bacterium UPWRP_1]|nr:hypothetical protein BVG80_06850 [Sphingobacteriales bacterium TSM_CSM]PSJ78166.1 hypothetical protein C7N43_04925 [Sphingobacteriales bacterium UPWRP_1]
MSNANICKLCLFCLLWAQALTKCVLAQNPVQVSDSVFRQEMDFGLYLLNNQQYAEAQQVFAQLDTATKSLLAPSRTDSLYFYHGWACYNQKLLLPATEQFLQISGNSPFFHASRYFAAYNLTHKEWYAPAKGILTDLYLPPSDSLLQELRFFQLSGIALLQRNFAQFGHLSGKYSFSHYQLQQQEQNMLQYAATLKKVKRRSPALAGMLSAVVPGLGKVYAGKVKQGVASFFPIALLGLQAFENIHKRGIKNGFSIFYTGLFSVFYVGNIWGSVLSVQIKQQEIYHEIDNRILFDLHIPLRNIFGN